jgi:hypothetical protein
MQTNSESGTSWRSIGRTLAAASSLLVFVLALVAYATARPAPGELAGAPGELAGAPATTSSTVAVTPEPTQRSPRMASPTTFVSPVAPGATIASPTPAAPASSPEAAEGSPMPAAALAVPGAGDQRYELVATLDYERATLDVVETFDWTNRSGQLANAISLNVIPAAAGAFNLTGDVTVNGMSTHARFARYDTNLVIAVPVPIADGEAVRIVIPFRLTVGQPDGALGARISNQRGVLQFGDWFPIWSTEHGFHPIGDAQVSWNAESIVLDLTATTDLGVDSVASSGSPIGVATSRHWRFEASHVRNFAFAVSPSYRVTRGSVECGGASVEVKAYTYHVNGRTVLDRAVRAMHVFGDSFGCYVQPTLSLAEVGSPYYSQEFPTLVFLGARVALDHGIVYHEIAHQWWYGMVGNDQMAEPWLDEAFAQFSAEMLSGRGTYCSSLPVNLTIHDFTRWTGCDSYYDTVYVRGADFLHQLRQRMGDEAFFAAAKSIVATHVEAHVTTQSVLDVFRSTSSVNLDDLISRFFAGG